MTSSGRIMALDLGTVWTGIAVSDPLGIITRPLTTVHTKDLLAQLPILCKTHAVTVLVVGLPRTLSGTESAQTRWTQDYIERIRATLSGVQVTTVDERLSSQYAQRVQRSMRTKQVHTAAARKEAKLAEHAQAAALMLEIYLLSLRMQQEDTTTD